MARAAVLRVQRVPHLSRRVVWSVVRFLAARVSQLPNDGRRTAHDVERAAFSADSIQLGPQDQLKETGRAGRQREGQGKEIGKDALKASS